MAGSAPHWFVLSLFFILVMIYFIIIILSNFSSFLLVKEITKIISHTLWDSIYTKLKTNKYLGKHSWGDKTKDKFKELSPMQIMVVLHGKGEGHLWLSYSEPNKK